MLEKKEVQTELQFREQFKKSYKFDKKSDVTFLQGDCIESIKSIPSGSINLIISSPPYNLNKEYEEKKAFEVYLEEMRPLLKELKRVLSDNGAICWQIGNHVSKPSHNKSAEIFPLDIFYYQEFSSLGFKLRNRIIWHFRSGMHAKQRLSGRYETMMWFTKSDDFTFNLDDIRIPQKYQGKVYPKGHKKEGQLSGNPDGMNPSDFWVWPDDFKKALKYEYDSGIWDFPNVKANHPEKNIHPCSYPIEMVERCVLAFSNKEEIILDPFCGVGSTLLGALNQGRRAIGCELKKEYMLESEKRVELLEKNELPFRKIGTPIKSATGKVAKRFFEEGREDTSRELDLEKNT